MKEKEKSKKEKSDDLILNSLFGFNNCLYVSDASSVDTFTWSVDDMTTDYAFGNSDWSTITTNVVTTTNTITSTLEFDDPFKELEEFREEKEKEEEMRKEYPSLQEAYDNYQLVKKLVEDCEFDKTFEKRYEGFSKK